MVKDALRPIIPDNAWGSIFLLIGVLGMGLYGSNEPI